MDTGLVENIAAYNIERVVIRTADGKALGEMQVSGSVSEDPAFTFMVRNEGDTIHYVATDRAGLQFAGTVTPVATHLASAKQ